MSRIDLDLWSHISQYLRSDELQTVTQVSKDVRLMSLPALFSTITCTIGVCHEEINQWSATLVRKANRLTQLIDHPKYKNFIRRYEYKAPALPILEFIMKSDNKLRADYKTFVDAVNNCFKAFGNIRTVTIHYAPLDRTGARALLNLPKLEEIWLEGAEVEWGNVDPTLRLRKVTIDNSEADVDSSTNFFSGEHLESLSIQNDSTVHDVMTTLVAEASNTNNITSSLVCPRTTLGYGQLGSLTHLSTEVTELCMVVFNRLIQICPHLKALDITHYRQSGQGLVLSAACIPKLEFFSGPGDFIPIIIPGRPVHTIIITTSNVETTPQIIKAMQRSTVPIQQIEIQSPFQFNGYKAMLDTIRVNFKELHKLKLTYKSKDFQDPSDLDGAQVLWELMPASWGSNDHIYETEYIFNPKKGQGLCRAHFC